MFVYFFQNQDDRKGVKIHLDYLSKLQSVCVLQRLVEKALSISKLLERDSLNLTAQCEARMAITLNPVMLQEVSWLNLLQLWLEYCTNDKLLGVKLVDRYMSSVKSCQVLKGCLIGQITI